MTESSPTRRIVAHRPRGPLHAPGDTRILDGMSSASSAPPLTDEQLAALVARRDWSASDWREAQDACAQLYGRHARPLLAYLAARVRRGDLEDVHQVIWERVWQRLPDGFRGGNFRAWVFQIARNYLIDRTRERRRPELLAEEYDAPDARGRRPDSVLIEREQLETLRRCLSCLDRETADLVQARLAGESYPDICRRLGLKPERAHKLFHQAKEQLQTCVARGRP
jgi:RNA polymerase sigma factor (sigma-70 family)